MKTILLAGATPLDPLENRNVPNAMIEIGGRPIITRVMDIYSHFGQRDFIVAAGGGSILLKQFFANYHMMASDLTVRITSDRTELEPTKNVAWTVRIVDTGLRTSDFDRIGQLRDVIGGAPFMLSYADALGNIDIEALLAFHRSHGKLATVTAVRPPVRPDGLQLRGNRVTACTRNLTGDDSWTSGGFFVCNPEVFDYLTDDSLTAERTPLMQLALDGELMAYRHHGFWHPLESASDRRYLEHCCKGQLPQWLRFDATAASAGVAAQ
jgi:glucose-1-phosphate cytidylyltransferase